MKLRSPLASMVVALSLSGLLAASALAQAPRYDVELVRGSCAEAGGPVIALAEPTADGDRAAAPAEMELVAAALGPAVSRAHDVLPMSLADIAASGHAVRVVERSRPPGRLVACGEFGAIDGDIGELQFGLVGLGDSGLDGVVWLRDNGDGTTGASLVIASPAVSVLPAGDAGEIEVAIRGSLYLPNPLEVAAGTTVTWINEDALPHTTTATDGTFDSGYMALGDRYSFTFETPGEYPIFCVYHPRMRALAIVH